MKLKECKDIVHAFLNKHNICVKLIEDKQLVYKHNHYHIRPDEAFLYNNNVIIIEYESTPRPVESISKYWWLLKNTNWLENKTKIKYCIFVLEDHNQNIRRETVIILGEELETKYQEYFEFNYLLPEKICSENIIEKLKNLL